MAATATNGRANGSRKAAVEPGETHVEFYLEKSIGKTGLRTLAPLLYATHRDEWQRVLLRR